MGGIRWPEEKKEIHVNKIILLLFTLCIGEILMRHGAAVHLDFVIFLGILIFRLVFWCFVLALVNLIFKLTAAIFFIGSFRRRKRVLMPIAIENKQLPATLNEKRQKESQQLKQKYGKGESKIMCTALDLLIVQEEAGFGIPILKK